jgi:hypothetical protein
VYDQLLPCTVPASNLAHHAMPKPRCLMQHIYTMHAAACVLVDSVRISSGSIRISTVARVQRIGVRTCTPTDSVCWFSESVRAEPIEEEDEWAEKERSRSAAASGEKGDARSRESCAALIERGQGDLRDRSSMNMELGELGVKQALGCRAYHTYASSLAAARKARRIVLPQLCATL